MIATVAIAALDIFTTYAATVAFGPDKFFGFSADNNGNPWDHLARGISSVMYILVILAIVNSTIANANAGANVFTHTAFAFGRVGAFPKWMGVLDPKHKSPRNALMVQLMVGLILGLGVGLSTHHRLLLELLLPAWS